MMDKHAWAVGRVTNIHRLAVVPRCMTWAPSLQKNCDFDGSGKILHQIREQIAALLAPQGNAAHTKLVTGFSDPHCGQIASSSDWWARRCHGTRSIEHQILRTGRVWQS